MSRQTSLRCCASTRRWDAIFCQKKANRAAVTWRCRFGADSQILGRSIKLDGVNQTVIGVMPAGFNFPDNAEAWRPMALMTDPGNSFLLPVIGRLKPGVSPEQAQAELETL